MLFTGWEVRIEKYFVEVSKTARGRRPRDVFETETKYFSIRTDRNGKYRIHFFFAMPVLNCCKIPVWRTRFEISCVCLHFKYG